MLLLLQIFDLTLICLRLVKTPHKTKSPFSSFHPMIRPEDNQRGTSLPIIPAYKTYGDVPRSTSHDVCTSKLIRFATASSHVADFNTRYKLITQDLLKQGYHYHKLPTCSKFFRRYYDLISKFHVELKSLLRQVSDFRSQIL